MEGFEPKSVCSKLGKGSRASLGCAGDSEVLILPCLLGLHCSDAALTLPPALESANPMFTMETK